MSAALELRGVTRRYDGRAALDGIDLSLEDGEYVTVLGASGSGKSVLLRVVAGFEQPDAGEILIHGKSVAGVSPHQRRIGFVFQSFALFPHLTVAENVGFGLRYARGARLSGAELDRRVERLLDLVGLGGLGDRQISQVSGGQEQRVALARTLAKDPALVLLDEPLGALDANLRESMKTELRAIQERAATTFVHVTGNEDEALAMGNRMLVLDRGRVAQFESPEGVFTRPRSVRVAHFLNRYNLIPGQLDGSFRSGSDVFEVPSDVSRGAVAAGASTPATYCVRFDQVAVRDEHDPVPAGHASVVARYVGREYAGASVTFLFEREQGGHMEAQYHLHASRPERLEERRSYRLVWPVEQARVYPEVLQ